VELVRRIGKNRSQRWVGARRRDEMKNKIIKRIYIYIERERLSAGNLTKRAKEIYKNISNLQNLIFK
jgi:DNA-binding Lrp family transcriptional regulator